MNFNYHNHINRNSINSSSNISIIELGNIPNHLMCQIYACTDTLSVLTGDLSLSMGIQKIESENPSPFLYHAPHWKSNLINNIYKMMAKFDTSSAQLFANYVNMTIECNTLPPDFPKNSNKDTIHSLGKLLYDPSVIDKYQLAMKNIRNIFNADRQNEHLNHRILWSVQKTVTHIVTKVMNGTYDFKNLIQDN